MKCSTLGQETHGIKAICEPLSTVTTMQGMAQDWEAKIYYVLQHNGTEKCGCQERQRGEAQSRRNNNITDTHTGWWWNRLRDRVGGGAEMGLGASHVHNSKEETQRSHKKRTLRGKSGGTLGEVIPWEKCLRGERQPEIQTKNNHVLLRALEREAEGGGKTTGRQCVEEYMRVCTKQMSMPGNKVEECDSQTERG